MFYFHGWHLHVVHTQIFQIPNPIIDVFMMVFLAEIESIRVGRFKIFTCSGAANKAVPRFKCQNINSLKAIVGFIVLFHLMSLFTLLHRLPMS